MSNARNLSTRVTTAELNLFDFYIPGEADSTQMLQRAIDAAALAGGRGVVVVPNAGVLGISGTVFMKSNVTLLGLGLPKIKAVSPFEGAMIQFGYTTGPIGPLEIPTNPCHDAEINGIELDGNYSVTMHHYSANVDSGLIHVWLYCKRNKVINCKIHSAECGLVEVEDVADFFELRGNDIYDATTTSATTQFINLINIDGPESAIIEGNNAYDLKQSGYSPPSWGYALRLHATDHCIVRGNNFQSGWNAVYIDGRSNLVTGNKIGGGVFRGLYLAANSFKCRYNSIISNYVDANANVGIQEENSVDVERNLIAFNTIKNAATPLSVTLRQSTVVGNKTYNASDVAQMEVSILGLDRGTTADTTSDLMSGTWTPGTISSITNASGASISNAQYTRVGSIVFFSGTATFTAGASGTYEIRFSPPIASTFTVDSDANGTASDTFSAYGAVYALVSGSPRLIRVVGTVTSSGAKTIRLSGSYIIK